MYLVCGALVFVDNVFEKVFTRVQQKEFEKLAPDEFADLIALEPVGVG